MYMYQHAHTHTNTNRQDTSGYDASVSDESAGKLLTEIWPKLQEAHDGFVRQVREQSESEFSKNLSGMLPEPGEMLPAGFSDRVEELARDSRTGLRKTVEGLTPGKAPWREKLDEKDGHLDMFEQHVRREIMAAKKEMGARVQESCQNMLKKRLSSALVCVCVCMHACMHVCMYVCMC